MPGIPDATLVTPASVATVALASAAASRTVAPAPATTARSAATAAPAADLPPAAPGQRLPPHGAEQGRSTGRAGLRARRRLGPLVHGHRGRRDASRAAAIVTGTGNGNPSSFTVASRAALADPAKGHRHPRLTDTDSAGPPIGQHARAGVVGRTGQGQRTVACGHAEGAGRLRHASRAHHARGRRLRAAGRRRVHRQRPDPYARELRPVRRHVIQRHGECNMRKDAP